MDEGSPSTQLAGQVPIALFHPCLKRIKIILRRSRRPRKPGGARGKLNLQ